ncbi:MAG: SUMF1/EgtB/PvdO family nonheme iron enzyme [Candidatus Wallbacteria bacterium]
MGIEEIFNEAKTKILAGKHPLISVDTSIKYAYLTGLTIMAATNAKDDFTEVEKEYLDAIAYAIDLSPELYQKALLNGKKPDSQLLATIVETIDQTHMQFLFLLDAYLLSQVDNDISVIETNIMKYFMQYFRFTNEECDKLKNILGMVIKKEYMQFMNEICKIEGVDELLKISILKYYFPKEYKTANANKLKYSDFEKIDLENGTILEMIYIEPGSFMMDFGQYSKSGEKAIREVIITKGFLIGKYPVTVKQWLQFKDKIEGMSSEKNFPAHKITWNDCQDFLIRLNSKKLIDGIFRLPTEAEWEYACRAGSTTEYYWGDNFDEKYCWYNGNSEDSPRPIGLKLPNAWGIYDMSGNVSEYCNNSGYKDYLYSEIIDPTCSYDDKYRITRGGSYSCDANECASSFSKTIEHDYYFNYDVGFRLVLSPNN